MNTKQTLNYLRALNERRRHLNRQIDDIVRTLRSPDMDGYCEASWEDIGKALGVSRQAAQQRYADIAMTPGEIVKRP